MEISTQQSYIDALPILLTAIQEAQFVTLDLEFGGIANQAYSLGKLPGLEERYRSVKEAAEKYPILQFGITTVRWSDSHSRFELKPFNITVGLTAPFSLGFDRTFSFSSDAARFLQRSGFRFENGFSAGVSFLSPQEEAIARSAPVKQLVFDVPIPTTDEERKDIDHFCAYVNTKLDLLQNSNVSSVSIFPFDLHDEKSDAAPRDSSPPLFSMYQKTLIRKCVDERNVGWRVFPSQDITVVRKPPSNPSPRHKHDKSGSKKSPQKPGPSSLDPDQWKVEREARILRDRVDLIPQQIGLRWLVDYMRGAVTISEIRRALRIDHDTEQDSEKFNRGGHRTSQTQQMYHEDPHSTLLAAMQMLRVDIPQDKNDGLGDAMDKAIAYIKEKQSKNAASVRDSENQAHSPKTSERIAKWDAIPSPHQKKKAVLVGHNSFTDLVFFHHTFIGALPDSLADFAKSIHDAFPAIIDTKYFKVKNGRILDPNLPLEHLVSPSDAHAEPVAGMYLSD